MDEYEVVLTIAGVGALIAAWVPAYTNRRPLSLPLVLVALGVGVGLAPLGLPSIDPRMHLAVTERTTEIVVIVSLMGAGLKIDRPFRWTTWRTTWRMLAVAMPLTIAATAVLGAWVGGLTAASAALLGSAIAPTDPVLASDVQVGEPTLEPRPAADAEDEVRFTLTSEAGLNDALAFPFVYGAILLGGAAVDGGSILGWVTWDLIGRVGIGIGIGWGVGRTLGVIAFRPPGPLRALSETPQGFVVVGATLAAYGITELCSGYGFLAVFVAAVVLRGSERSHQFLGELHAFADQLENLLVVGLLLVFGTTLTSGMLDGLTIGGATVALLVVFVVRPVAGAIALVGAPLTRVERSAIAFFGIRGFGSVYYLAFGLGHGDFAGAATLWAILTVTVVVSIATHGITATPVMAMVDRAARARRRVRRRDPRR